MKKAFLSLISILVVAVMLSAGSFSAAPEKATEGNLNPDTVTLNNTQKFDDTKVLESRFLNMLNHNFVYDTDFDYVERIVNNSVFALLDMRDNEDESFIAETYVKDYVFNMYGIEIEDFSEINADFPKKEGYVYIIPRGYSLFQHSIVSVNENEDGSYTVITEVTEDTHDDGEVKLTCTSLFVKNQLSDFGYVIINSNFNVSTSQI